MNVLDKDSVMLGNAELNTRLICIYSVLGVYGLFAAVTVAAIIYCHIHSKDGLLAKRSIPLVVFQAVVGTATGAAALAATAQHQLSCALKLWIISPGITLWLAAVAVRGVQHLVLVWTSKVQNRMLRQEAQSECVPVSHTNAGSGLEAPFYHSSVFEQSYRPNTAQTLYVWSEFGGNTTRHSQESLPGVHELRAVAHTQARLGRLARTRTLLFILMLAGALLMAYTAIVSVRSRTYSIYIPRAACTVDSGWEIWLPYGIAITCIGPVFLALEVAMWMTNDVYNTRADIFACMVSSQIALIVYVLWVTVLSNVRTHLSEMFIVWLAMLVAHIFSICWPLWCSIRQRSHLEAQPLRSGFGHPYRETRLRRSLYSPLYKEFEEMLDSSVQRENFLQFATQYYRSGLPLFLSDFQLLKYQVIEALKDSRHSTCTDNSHLAPHPVTNQHAVQLVKDDRYPHESHPLAHLVPITKGIFESAMLLLPPNSIDKTTQFPEAVKSAFSNFVCTYFGRESYMAVSIPNEAVARIQKAVELSNVPLSVLDCAKDEVLFLLCTDVFAGYRKRLEAQCCSTVS